ELVNFLQQRRLTRNTAAPLAPGAIEAARTAFKPATVMTKIETNGDRRAVLPPTLSVKDLAEKLGVSPVEVIKKLMASKILATINQVIDFATAEIVADEFGFTVEPVASEDVVAVESAEGQGDVVTTSREELFSLANEDPAKLKARPPIVTVLGHVDHGKTSILVAINKIDKDNANVDRVHQQLAEQGIVTRHYGGEHECVHLSARTGKGIDDLLTTIVLSSDILELKANPDRNAIGTIVDAHLERGRGPVATVLVQAGTLKVGDDFVCGHIYGRVRALADDRGRGVGAVSDSDLLLAGVSSAIIVCFNLKATPASTAAAERAKVEVRYYDVIYKLTEDVERAAKGLREPTYRQIREGRVEVITPIKIPRLGVIAGSRVVEGKVSRGGWVKLFRAREQVFEGRISSLKHFKEDVREMPAGQECGIGLEGWEDFQPGDTMETYRLEREDI